MRTRIALSLLILALLPCVTQAAFITFGGLGGSTGDALLPYTENGFIVTPITGRWMEMTTTSPTPGVTGNPGPSIWEDTFTASLEITEASGGQFTFGSVDLWGRTADYTIEGLLNGTTVFTVAADIPSDDWLTVASPSFAPIDKLRISAIRDQAEYSNVDNIGVTTVPEPPPIVIVLGGSLLLIGACGCRHRRFAH
jgi:hypothetical protein